MKTIFCQINYCYQCFRIHLEGCNKSKALADVRKGKNMLILGLFSQKKY